MASKAAEAGDSDTREPQEYGQMYGRSFWDVNGNLREVVDMDENAIKKAA